MWKAFDIALAMSGLRLDAGRYLFAWIPLLGASVWLGYQAERSGWLVEYAISTWVFYYVGISLILGTRIKSVMLEKFGENNATKLYDMICGLMFFNIGLGVAAAALHYDAAIPMPTGPKMEPVCPAYCGRFWNQVLGNMDRGHKYLLFSRFVFGKISRRVHRSWPLQAVGQSNVRRRKFPCLRPCFDYGIPYRPVVWTGLPHGDLRILLHRRKTIHPANIPIRLSLESRNLCGDNNGCSLSGHSLAT